MPQSKEQKLETARKHELIAKLCKEGLADKLIAERVGMSLSRVRDIKRRVLGSSRRKSPSGTACNDQ